MPDLGNSESRVLVFRKRLLPYSETFIADQGKNLVEFEAVFTGFHSVGSGLGLLQPNPVITLDEVEPYPRVAKLMFRLGRRGAGAWVRQIQSYRPSLVHAHFLNDGKDAMALAKSLDVPLVTTLHGHDITKHERSGKIPKCLARDPWFAEQNVWRSSQTFGVL